MVGFSIFSKQLIQWYDENKRDLPWRKTTDPYLIWVSEIMLQQTRVDQGINYYLRFIKKFPNITSLAKANEQEILTLWQGLGYYSRARNLHKSAKLVLTNYKGIFPTKYEHIIELPGIGEYTAAAIASFAFKLPYPVIDGNVNRLVTRLYGIDLPIHTSAAKKLIFEKTNELFDAQRPDEFNQAIMEFGALHCLPANPSCKSCPFSTNCLSFNLGKVDTIPIRQSAIKKKDRFFNYAILQYNDKLILKKRVKKDIWKNMYDFPLTEHNSDEESFELNDKLQTLYNTKVKMIPFKSSDWKTHILTHQRIHARFHHYSVQDLPKEVPQNWETATLKNVDKYPVPKLIEHYINGL